MSQIKSAFLDMVSVCNNAYDLQSFMVLTVSVPSENHHTRPHTRHSALYPPPPKKKIPPYLSG